MANSAEHPPHDLDPLRPDRQSLAAAGSKSKSNKLGSVFIEKRYEKAQGTEGFHFWNLADGLSGGRAGQAGSRELVTVRPGLSLVTSGKMKCPGSARVNA